MVRLKSSNILILGGCETASKEKYSDGVLIDTTQMQVLHYIGDSDKKLRCLHNKHCMSNRSGLVTAIVQDEKQNCEMVDVAFNQGPNHGIEITPIMNMKK